MLWRTLGADLALVSDLDRKYHRWSDLLKSLDLLLLQGLALYIDRPPLLMERRESVKKWLETQPGLLERQRPWLAHELEQLPVRAKELEEPPE